MGSLRFMTENLLLFNEDGFPALNGARSTGIGRLVVLL